MAVHATALFVRCGFRSDAVVASSCGYASSACQTPCRQPGHAWPNIPTLQAPGMQLRHCAALPSRCPLYRDFRVNELGNRRSAPLYRSHKTRRPKGWSPNFKACRMRCSFLAGASLPGPRRHARARVAACNQTTREQSARLGGSEVSAYSEPSGEGVRVDAALYAGGKPSMHYATPAPYSPALRHGTFRKFICSHTDPSSGVRVGMNRRDFSSSLTAHLRSSSDLAPKRNNTPLHTFARTRWWAS